MARDAKTAATQTAAPEEPANVHRYLGFEFIEYPGRWDFRLGKRSGRLSKLLSLFSLAVLIALGITGWLVKVHVKVPVNGQMVPLASDLAIGAPMDGVVTVHFDKDAKTVTEGQILLTINPKDQANKVSELENEHASAMQDVERTARDITGAQNQRLQAEQTIQKLASERAAQERELTNLERLGRDKKDEFANSRERMEIALEEIRVSIDGSKKRLERQKEQKDQEIRAIALDIDGARKSVDNRTAEFESARRLHERGGMATNKFDEAKEALDDAQRKLESFELKLLSTTSKLDGEAADLERELAKSNLSLRDKEAEKSKLALDERNFEFENERNANKVRDQIMQIDHQTESAQLQIRDAEEKIAAAGNTRTSAELKVKTLALRLETARSELASGREIRAPHDGFVLEVMVTSGQKVTLGQPLVKIGGEKLEFVGLVEERYLTRVEPGQPVKIKFAAFQRGGSEDIEHPGEVTANLGVNKGDPAKQGPKTFGKIKIRIDPPDKKDHADQMPQVDYGGTGNVLTQEMPLLKYWVLHKVLKKV